MTSLRKKELSTPEFISSSSDIRLSPGLGGVAIDCEGPSFGTSGTTRSTDETTALINGAIEKNSYRDYSRVTVDKLSKEIEQEKSRKPTFPRKLHEILSSDSFSDIIAWLPHGRSWKVLDSSRLETEVLPRFYRHGSRASFLRQVNNWGFKRVASGRDSNSYYNEFFLRGLPHVCLLMGGRKPRKQGAPKHSSPSFSRMFRVAPDFYKISEIHPLPPPDEPPGNRGEQNKTEESSARNDSLSPPVVSQMTLAGCPLDGLISIPFSTTAATPSQPLPDAKGNDTGDTNIALKNFPSAVGTSSEATPAYSVMGGMNGNMFNPAHQMPDPSNLCNGGLAQIPPSAVGNFFGGYSLNQLMGANQFMAQQPNPLNQLVGQPGALNQLIGQQPFLGFQQQPNWINFGMPPLNRLDINPAMMSIMQNALGSSLPQAAPLGSSNCNMPPPEQKKPETPSAQADSPNHGEPQKNVQ